MALTQFSQLSAAQRANLAWAFSKAPHEDKVLFDRIANDVSSNIADYDAVALSKIAYSIVKRRSANARHLLAIIEEELLTIGPTRSQSKISLLKDPHCLADLSWAFARINVGTEALFTTLERVIRQCQLSEFDAKDLSEIASAFAAAKPNAQALFATIAQEVQNRPCEFDARSLSSIVLAFAKAEFDFEHPVYNVIADRVNKNISAFNKIDLKCLIRAFEKIKPNAKELLGKLYAHLSGLSYGGFLAKQVDKHKQACEKQFSHFFSNDLQELDDISNKIIDLLNHSQWKECLSDNDFSWLIGCYSSIRSNIKKSKEGINTQDRFDDFFSAFSKATMELLPTIGPRIISNIVGNFALAAYPAPELSIAIAKQFLPKMADFNAFDLAQLIWGLGTAGAFWQEVKEIKDFIEAIDQEIQSPGKLDDEKANPKTLSQMLVGFERLGFNPVGLFVINKRILVLIGSFGPQELANTAHSLAILSPNYQNDDILPKVFNAIEVHACKTKLEGFSPLQIANIAWAFYKVDIDAKELFSIISELILKPSVFDELEREHLLMLLDAYVYFGKIHPELELYSNSINAFINKIKVLPFNTFDTGELVALARDL